MVKYIELTNKFQTKVILSNIGASIYDIKTKDKFGNVESILYTTKNKDDFLIDGSYLGKTIGRTGGRIANNKFVLNGKEYIINSKDPNGLHGGIDGFGYKEFTYLKNETNEYKEVKFSCISKDLESGYPGNLYLDITYRLYNDINKLVVLYEAISDKDTLLNISNHSYFNLSGNAKNNILEQKLFIDADKMERIENLLPQEIVNCSDIYSFNKMHKIGDHIFDPEIINNTNGYDFPYIFNNNKNDYKIILKDDVSKRQMKIKTSYPVVVVYTCNYVGDIVMNNNKKMEPYYAICLECMYYPNAINSEFLDKKYDVLKKDTKYKESIEFSFEVDND